MKLLRTLHTIDNMICRAINQSIFKIKNVDCQTDIRNINGIIRIAGSGRISIGTNTRINSGRRHNPIGGDTCVTLVCRNGGEIKIGSHCGLSNFTIVSDSNVDIGDHVLIGGGVKIYDTDFHSIDPTNRINESPGTYQGLSRQVLIHKNAFIGAHSIILKGVSIGENSVIGAGSVVSKNVPANEIWAGNPAVQIRRIS